MSAIDLSSERAIWRARLGRIGIRTTALGRVSIDETKLALSDYEKLGFGAIWIPDAPEIFSLASLVLSSTEKLVACASIASIYTRDAVAAENGAALLGR